MESKQLKYISELSCYRVRSILFRLVIVSAVAFMFMFLADLLVVPGNVRVPKIQYLKVIITFNIISEMNILLDNIAERYLPIPSKVVLRVFLHFILSTLIGVLVLIYFQHQIKTVDVIAQPATWLMFAFGFIFTFILVVIAISMRITGQWVAAKQEVNELRQTKLINDYNALQDQLNPHFLFNNLSVLKSMIKYDPDAAVEFTQNFTDTYRYVLQCRDKTTIQLSVEIDFIRSYISLHKERLGEGLYVKFDINETIQNKELPPLSLQLLVENAIKHNIVSKDQPLCIHIYTKENAICIENNLQLKESTYSSHKGLRNLIARYAMLTEQKVVIVQNEENFSVELPLL